MRPHWKWVFWLKKVELKTSKEIRKNIDTSYKEQLIMEKPELYVNVFRHQDEETAFRSSFVRFERSRGIRVGHCPGVIKDMFQNGALSLDDTGYKEMFDFGEKIRWRLKGIEEIHVTCPNGSDFTISVANKEFVIEKTNIPAER